MAADIGSELKQMFTKEQEENTALEAVKLLTNKKNLALKTEIEDPLNFSILTALADYLKRRGMKESAKFIADIQENYMVYMVSKKRKSREEIIEVIKGIEAPEADVLEKLTRRGE